MSPGRVATQCSAGVASIYRAVLAARMGKRQEAARMAQRGIQLIDEGEYHAIGNAARLQLGRFLGEHDGLWLIEQAMVWFKAQGVVDVERMASLLAPDFNNRELALR